MNDSSRLPARLPVSSAIFVAIGIAIAGGGILLAFAALVPAPFVSDENAGALDAGAILSAVGTGAVGARQDEIVAFGSRLPGQPGYARMIEYVRRAYARAGLEIHEISFPVVSPLSRRREIRLLDNGRELPLEQLDVYPLFPNAVQPVVTPPDGLDGRLVLLTPDEIRRRRDFNGVIGLIDTSPGRYDEELGFAWERYARLGLEAVILFHPEGIAHIPWNRVHPEDRRSGMSISAPVNYVRAASGPEIADYVGKEIRLFLDTRYEPAQASNLIGILRAPVRHGRRSS